MLRCLQETGAEPAHLDELKLLLRIDSMEDDGLLKDLLKSARIMIENATSMSLVKKQWVRIAHKPDRTFEMGKQLFYLPRGPVIAVTQVTLESLSREERLLPEEFRLWESSSRSFVLSNRPLELGSSWLRVFYDAGFDQPSDIPGDLRQAVVFVAANLYKEQANLASALLTSGLNRFLTPSIQQLIQPYRPQRLV